MSIHRSLAQPWTVPLSQEAQALVGGASYGQGGYAGANRAIYEPFILPVTKLMTAMSLAVSVTGSGTADLGLYNAAGTLIASMGSTSIATGTFSWTPTPIMLEAGRRYFAAVAMSTTSAQCLRIIAATNTMRIAGCAQEASALPLPSTMTPAQIGTTNYPIIALTLV